MNWGADPKYPLATIIKASSCTRIMVAMDGKKIPQKHPYPPSLRLSEGRTTTSKATVSSTSHLAVQSFICCSFKTCCIFVNSLFMCFFYCLLCVVSYICIYFFVVFIHSFIQPIDNLIAYSCTYLIFLYSPTLIARVHRYNDVHIYAFVPFGQHELAISTDMRC